MPLSTVNTPPLAVPAYTNSQSPAAQSNNFWGDNGFKSALDIINPLQQLPIVSSIYRALSGDTISSGSRIAGATLIGGPIGLVVALANEVVQTQTGNDVGGNVLHLLANHSDDTTKNTVVAFNETASYPNPHQRTGYNAYVQAQMLAS